MKPFNFIVGKPVAAIAVTLLAAASLTACGGGSETHNYPDTTPAPTPAPVPMLDAFFAAVSGIVSASSDATEPNTIDALVATSPENTEPEPLG